MGSGCRLKVRVVPNARRDGFAGVMDDGETVRLRIAAPAVDGKANAALLRYLGKVLRASRGGLELCSGERSRSKTVRVDGMNRAEVLERLEAGSA